MPEQNNSDRFRETSKLTSFLLIVILSRVLRGEGLVHLAWSHGSFALLRRTEVRDA